MDDPVKPDRCTRPRTIAIVAQSLDGKLARHPDQRPDFTSPEDRLHLETQVAAWDGVVMGAATLRAYGTSVRIRRPELLDQRHQRHQAPQPITIICSQTGHIPSDLPFFRQPLTRWLWTTPLGAQTWKQQRVNGSHGSNGSQGSNESHGSSGSNGSQGSNESHGSSRSDGSNLSTGSHRSNPSNGFDQIWTASSWNLHERLAQSWDHGLQTLGILGGGQLIGAFLEADLLDELWITLCPIIIGHQPSAPTSFAYPPDTSQPDLNPPLPQLQLLELHHGSTELFLHYRIRTRSSGESDVPRDLP